MKQPSYPNWRAEIRSCIRSVHDLNLPPAIKAKLSRVEAHYPTRIPPHLAGLMDITNPRCPIRRQLVPDPKELDSGGQQDPLDENRFQVTQGVIRRFSDRLLALVANQCPVLCRHCNRKRAWNKPFPVAEAESIATALTRAKGIKEVILSGGEPLLLTDQRLDQLLQAARSSAGVEIVRIHSRAPVSIPARITTGLLRALSKHQPIWLVTHFNHAKEVSGQAKLALCKLRSAGIPVLNQAVLLKGVNDTLRAQVNLGRALVACGVKPHYLFQLDQAKGTLHFQVPFSKSLELIQKLSANYSGLLVPSLMLDLPGKGGKVPISPSALIGATDDPSGIWLRGVRGEKVFFRFG